MVETRRAFPSTESSPEEASDAWTRGFASLPLPAVLVRSPRSSGSLAPRTSAGVARLAAGLVEGEEVLVALARTAATRGEELTRHLPGLRTDVCVVRALPRPVEGGVLVELVDETGRAPAAVPVRRDLTERAFDALPVALAAKDPHDGLRYTMVNRRFEELFGVRREDLVGRTDRDLLDPAAAATEQAADHAALDADGPSPSLASIRTGQGVERAEVLRGTVRGADGEVELLLVVPEADSASASVRAGGASGEQAPALRCEPQGSPGSPGRPSRMRARQALDESGVHRIPRVDRRPRLRVLVVDDNTVQQRITARHLEDLGHDVLVASSGRAAMQVLDAEREQLDVLLVDARLRDVDGLEVVARLRQREARDRVGWDEHLSAVVIGPGAGELQPAERDRLHHASLEAGADRWLEKPLRPGDLAREIQVLRIRA